MNCKFYVCHSYSFARYDRLPRRSSIGTMAMMWVEYRAQFLAWVSSFVTKPGAVCCANACISKSLRDVIPERDHWYRWIRFVRFTTANCSFIFGRTYRLGHVFHAILDLMWEGPAKKWQFFPQPDTSTDFRSLNHTFSIAANLLSTWKVWLRSVQQS